MKLVKFRSCGVGKLTGEWSGGWLMLLREAIAIRPQRRPACFLYINKHIFMFFFWFFLLKNKLINIHTYMYMYILISTLHRHNQCVHSNNGWGSERPHYANKQTSPTVGRSCYNVVLCLPSPFGCSSSLCGLNFCILKAS